MKKFGKFLVTVTAITGAVAGALVVFKKFKKDNVFEDDFVDIPKEDIDAAEECDCTDAYDCSDACESCEDASAEETCADCEVVPEAC